GQRLGAPGVACQADHDDARRRFRRCDGQALRRGWLSGRRRRDAGAGVREDCGRQRGRPASGAMRVPAVVGRHRTALRGLCTGEGRNADRCRRLLCSEGFQVLGPAESGDAQATNARGWTEYGEFDHFGHDLQAKLAARIEDQLELLLERVQGLLETGWKRVRVVTDHGWLLVPGGMPKVQLPKYLAESRWSRCASIKDGSHVEVPVAGWSWNPQERFAYAPGVHCFMAGQEYAHGGASLQECLIPVLTVAP